MIPRISLFVVCSRWQIDWGPVYGQGGWLFNNSGCLWRRRELYGPLRFPLHTRGYRLTDAPRVWLRRVVFWRQWLFHAKEGIIGLPFWTRGEKLTGVPLSVKAGKSAIIFVVLGKRVHYWRRLFFIVLFTTILQRKAILPKNLLYWLTQRDWSDSYPLSSVGAP